MRDDGLMRAIERAGGLRALARKLGLAHASVAEWRRVPIEHVFKIEDELNLDREITRPDLFLRPRRDRPRRRA